MVLQNYQNFTEMTSNMIYIVAFCVGLKCPRKIHLNTQCSGGGGGGEVLTDQLMISQPDGLIMSNTFLLGFLDLTYGPE